MWKKATQENNPSPLAIREEIDSFIAGDTMSLAQKLGIFPETVELLQEYLDHNLGNLEKYYLKSGKEYPKTL